MAGKIGTAGFLRNDEAAELDDEFEAVGAGDGIPANPSIAVLESLGGTGPTQDGDEVFAAVFRVVFVNSLPDDMSGGAAGFEVVLGIQDGAELADFKRFGGGANLKGRIDLKTRCEGCRGGHNSPTMQI